MKLVKPVSSFNSRIAADFGDSLGSSKPAGNSITHFPTGGRKLAIKINFLIPVFGLFKIGIVSTPFAIFDTYSL